VGEMARILRKSLILTVPDISAIPVLYRHNIVPWHLLEATHVNFFTQKSLSELLKKYFSKIDFARIGPNVVNGTTYYTSIVGICSK